MAKPTAKGSSKVVVKAPAGVAADGAGAQDVSFDALVPFSHDLADKAAAAIRPYFRQRLTITDKNAEKGLAGFDPVTAADKAAEEVVRAAIAARFPDHAILGEEFGLTGTGPWRWIIDPIDGTRAFMMGLLSWGLLVGLAHHETPVFGMMAQPHTGEVFWNDGTGAWLRNPDTSVVPLKTRPCPTLKDAVIACTDPSLFKQAGELAAYQAIAKEVRMARYGGDCYAYAMVAAGCIDAVIESGLQPYDIAALVPIVEKAGGCLTTWSGAPALANMAKEGGRVLASGDPALHATLVARLKGV
jgi:myo-inositol-1(or 4)-monophosphatase